MRLLAQATEGQLRAMNDSPFAKLECVWSKEENLSRTRVELRKLRKRSVKTFQELFTLYEDQKPKSWRPSRRGLTRHHQDKK